MASLRREFLGVGRRLRNLLLQDIEGVVEMLERRDEHMADHARKVRRYAVEIARQMGLGQRHVHRIRIAATLHDVGMAAMPDEVLRGDGPLTDAQRQLVRRHPLLGVRVMENMECLEQEIPAVRYHHERFDGAGYPEGIAGNAIPLSARILAVADTFDAITSPRAFRDARCPREALETIADGAGTRFDPDVVSALLAAAAHLGEGLWAPPAQTVTA